MSILGLKIDALFVAAQLVGFLATGMGVASYQTKHRSNIIIRQIIANTGWIIHYLMLGSYSAVVANSIGTVRNILYSFRGKYKFADSKLIPTISIIIFVISGAITYKDAFDILPTFAMIVASIALYIKDEKIIRYLSILLPVSWLLYAIRHFSIAGVISESLVLISVVVSIVRYHGMEKQNGVDVTKTSRKNSVENEEIR